jgi:hypothetical protein
VTSRKVAPTEDPAPDATRCPDFRIQYPARVFESTLANVNPHITRVTGRQTSAQRSRCQGSVRGLCVDQFFFGRAEYCAPEFSSWMRSGRPREEKGLRHFAVRICHKVEQKGETTYNEVADELVAELLQGNNGVAPRDPASEEKNVRRRVYDALNVLCAIGVVHKDRRAVRWHGLPRASVREQSLLENELSRLSSSVRDKDGRIQRYRTIVRALERLVQRNMRGAAVASSGRPRSASLQGDSAVRLPFLLIATDPDAAVDIDGDEPGSDRCSFTFNRPFQVYDADGVLLELDAMICNSGARQDSASVPATTNCALGPNEASTSASVTAAASEPRL